MSPEGRVVVITGASRGLGRAFAQSFAEQGASLGLLARDEGALDEVAAEVPTEAIGVACDITNEQQVATAFRNVAERFGGIDVVVANAGGQLAAQHAEHLPVEQWRRTVELNLTGAYLTARSAHRYLSESHAARMIFVSSGAAKVPLPRMCAYAAAKAGVEGLLRALCVEWARDGICVNAVAPGLIDTSGSREVPEKIKEAILHKTTLGHPGHMPDVMDAVMYLARRESGYITGQTLSVDGGYGLG